MRLSRIFTSVSWKYAVGEVVLIVIGISIALSADSWWEDRQNRQEEETLLSQILLTLRSDRTALAEIGAEVRNRANLLAGLREHLREDLPYSPAISDNVRALRYWQTSRVNRAAYEDLKARGLDLVHDQQLRLMLIDYFDNQVPRLEDYDRIDRQQTMNYSSTILQKHLIWDEDVYEPVDAERMMSDSEFRYMVGAKAGVVNGRAFMYEELVATTDSLIDYLEDVLEPR